MAAGVGVFSTEGWAEGVDFGQGTSVRLAIQLARYGQECFFTEEVLVEINFAFWRAR
ncbi:hypothetical protein D3C87_1692550 [compost metagenome]